MTSSMETCFFGVSFAELLTSFAATPVWCDASEANVTFGTPFAALMTRLGVGARCDAIPLSARHPFPASTRPRFPDK